MFHHVLVATDSTDALGRPVFVCPAPSDELPAPSSEAYRVYRSAIRHGGSFCFVTAAGERFCSIGPDHEHREPEA